MELLRLFAGPLLAQEGPEQVARFPVLLLGLACLVVAVAGAIIVGVLFARSGRSEVVQSCPYCGTHIRGRLVLQCPNCRATLGPSQQ